MKKYHQIPLGLFRRFPDSNALTNINGQKVLSTMCGVLFGLGFCLFVRVVWVFLELVLSLAVVFWMGGGGEERAGFFCLRNPAY